MVEAMDMPDFSIKNHIKLLFIPHHNAFNGLSYQI
jgi:hypothetical protein